MQKKTDYGKMLAEIAQAGVGAKVDPVKLVRANPSAAALLSKLTQDPTRQPVRDGQGKLNPATINPAGFNNISTDVARNIHETDIIMQMHPDLELAAQILVSSVLAPNDMVTVELTYSAERSNLPADVVASLIEKAKSYIDETHKIEEELPRIVRGVLIEAGCYPIAIIPENSVDELINSRVGYGFNGSQSASNRAWGSSIGVESAAAEAGFAKKPEIRLSTGILGPRDSDAPSAVHANFGVGLESMFSLGMENTQVSTEDMEVKLANGIKTGLTVIDNPAMLYVPEMAAKVRERAVRQKVRGRWGLEDRDTQFAHIKTLEPVVNRDSVFKQPRPDYVPIRPVLTKDNLHRRPIGAPLVMRLPPESTIPVYVPGYPEKHIGYFVLLDNEGNPVARKKDQDLYHDLGQRLKGSNDLASHLLQRVDEGMKGFDFHNRSHIDYAARIYAGMVEEDLISRLKNGMYGRRFSISENSEVYRMMLSRSLKNDHTALLYIPEELLTYFAIRFNEDGTGKSLMQDTRIVNSLRSIVTFANIHTAIRNAISRTKISVTLDEDDEDPLTTIEKVKGEILRSRAQGMPTGTSNPNEITNWLTSSGYEFEFQGNKGISEMKIDFSESASSHVLPDNDLEEKLRNKSIQGFGLTPEMVDAGFNAEYAASVVANNLLLSKRVIQIQDEITPHVNHLLRSSMHNCGTITFRLRQILEENMERILSSVPAYKEVKLDTKEEKEDFVEFLLESFIDSFDAALPRPNSATLENQMAHMDEYEKALDKMLDQIINSDFMTSDSVGELEAQVGMVKAVIKAHYMRHEMAKIGLLPEMAELMTLDDKGKPVVKVYDELSTHINTLTKVMGRLMEGIRPIRDASNDVNEGKDENAGGGGGDSYSEEPADGGDTGGDMFGMDGPDPLAMPEDGGGGGGETPPPDGEAQPEEETPSPDAEPEEGEDATPAS